MVAPGQVPPWSGGPEGSQVALRTLSLVRPLADAMGPVLVSATRKPRTSWVGTASGCGSVVVVVMVAGVVIIVVPFGRWLCVSRASRW